MTATHQSVHQVILGRVEMAWSAYLPDVWQDERVRFMLNARAFDVYVEQPVRLFVASLIYFQCNRRPPKLPHRWPPQTPPPELIGDRR